MTSKKQEIGREIKGNEEGRGRWGGGGEGREGKVEKQWNR